MTTSFAGPETSTTQPAPTSTTPMDIAVDNVANPTTYNYQEVFQNRPFTSGCGAICWSYIQLFASCGGCSTLSGCNGGPLFCWKDGSPVTRPKFVERLRSTLQAAGVDPSHYSGHSFRIGVATVATANRIGDATFQLLGRWNSHSYVRYVRSLHKD